MTYQQILDKNTTPARPDVTTNQIVVLDFDMNADGFTTLKLCDGEKIMVLHVARTEIHALGRVPSPPPPMLIA